MNRSFYVCQTCNERKECAKYDENRLRKYGCHKCATKLAGTIPGPEYYTCKTCKKMIPTSKANKVRKYGCTNCAYKMRHGNKNTTIVNGKEFRFPVGTIGYNFNTKVMIWE